MKPYESESIDNKLFRLKQIIEILDGLSKSSKDDFVKDYRLNNSAMFNLLIGITIILDTGQYLLAKSAGKIAGEYREVIKILGEENIVPKEFAVENENMARFRNLLVHDYDKIDELQVYDFIQSAPEIFRKFTKYFVEFMGTK